MIAGPAGVRAPRVPMCQASLVDWAVPEELGRLVEAISAPSPPELRNSSTDSRTATSASAMAARGSAHHQPNVAVRTRATRIVVASQPSRSVIGASAKNGALPSRVPITRFHRARPNITSAVTDMYAIPSGEELG